MNMIAPTTTGVNWHVGAPAASPVVAAEQYNLGYDYYVACEPLTRCANAMQRRGWLAANRHEAVALSNYDGSEGW